MTAPDGNDYVAVNAGTNYSLALKSDGSIIGWGDNYDGKATPLGGNDFVAISAGHNHGLALKTDGSIVGWGMSSYGRTTPPDGNDYIAIAAGGDHSLALKADGSIVGWGNNWYGQATPPDGNDYVAIAAGCWHSLALKSDGSIVGWGANWYGQAEPPDGNDFVAIAAGTYHSIALRETELPPVEAKLWLWPKRINRHSRGHGRILACMRLPEGITEDHVDKNTPLVLYPGEIESCRQYVFSSHKGQKPVKILAFFSKRELLAAISDNGRIELEVNGHLKDGRVFYGTDTIRIRNKRHPRRPWWHRR